MSLFVPDSPDARFRQALAQSIASTVFGEVLAKMPDDATPTKANAIARDAFDRVAATHRAVGSLQGQIAELVADLMRPPIAE